jgi:NAD(P)-dependent dehydrogenase (short-subunit alcohol dehydrogenase family)
MKGKNCLITGANSGIGFKIAEIYAEKGFYYLKIRSKCVYGLQR